MAKEFIQEFELKNRLLTIITENPGINKKLTPKLGSTYLDSLLQKLEKQGFIEKDVIHTGCRPLTRYKSQLLTFSISGL